MDDYGGYGLPVDPSSFDYGPTGIGLQVDHTFVMTNTGKVPATDMAGTLQGSAFSFKGGSYPGAGGSCGATLAPGASCTLIVTYTAPSGNNPSNTGALAIDYKAGTTRYDTSRELTGEQSDKPTITINDEQGFSVGASFDYGLAGSHKAHTFYIQNTGATPVTFVVNLTGNSFFFDGDFYPGLGGTCDMRLMPLEECTVVITFSPSTGAATGTLSVKALDAASNTVSVARNVQGTGTTAAVLSLLPTQGDGRLYDYGIVVVGSSSDGTFRLANVGGSDATLSAAGLPAPFSYKGGSYPGQGGTCGASLAAGTDCTVVVTFAPAMAGSSSANLAIGTATLPLVGAGTDRALLSVTDRKGGAVNPPTFDYGTAGIPLDHTFYVRNLGVQAATSLSGGTLFAPFSFKGGSYPGQGGTCGASLAPGVTCTLVVTFTPGNGPATTFVGVSYFDGTWTQTAGQVITGTATTRAHLIITECLGCVEAPGWTDYGTAGTPISRTLYVTNVGVQTATQVTLVPNSSTSFDPQSACGSSLASGESCSIVTIFMPTRNDPAAEYLEIDYVDGSTQQRAFRGLHGISTTAPLLTVNDWSSGVNADGPFDYGAPGSPVDHTFYVLSSGGSTATAIGDGGTLGGGFAFKGGAFPGQGGTCGTSLTPRSSCTVVVTFSPGSSAQSSSTLTLAFSDGTLPLTATRALTGAAGSTASLTITELQGQSGSNPNPFDYGTTGLPKDQSFYVTNSGGQQATSLLPGPFGGGFGFKGGAFPGQGGTCGTSLGQGASCTVVVTFTPSGDGIRSGTLALSYNDGASLQTATRTLIGTATSRALITISNTSAFAPPCNYPCEAGFYFGSWPSNPSPVPTHTFYVFNTGAQAANVSDHSGLSAPFSYVGGAYPGTGASCSGPLVPGASCTLNVQFDPTGPGQYRYSLFLDVSDSAGFLERIVWDLLGDGQ